MLFYRKFYLMKDAACSEQVLRLTASALAIAPSPTLDSSAQFPER